MLVIERASHEQIYHQLRAEIETGIRATRQKLPSTRYLAQTLQVSRNTVDHAYQDLVAEGYLVSKPGAGYVVAPQLPVLTAQTTPLLAPTRSDFTYDFTESYDHLTLFPKNAWQLAEQAVMLHGVAHIQPANGDLQYRQQLTRYLARLKGLQVKAEQIVVTSGFNEAAGIIANLLPLSPNDELAVTEPIAPNAREVWTNLGLKVTNFQLKSTLPTAAAYVLAPTHNFPDGHGLTKANRESIAQQLKKSRRYLVELDTDGALVYDGQLAPALHHYLAGQRCFYYTNYDDTLGSSLCMGILVLPTELVAAYQTRYGQLPNRNSEWQQQILTRMIANDSLERYIRQLTIVYRNRRQLLINALQQSFGDAIKIVGAAAGTFLVVTVPPSQSVDALIVKAAAVEVGLVNPDRCWRDGRPHNHQIVFSFRQVNDEQIIDGIQRLTQAWQFN